MAFAVSSRVLMKATPAPCFIKPAPAGLASVRHPRSVRMSGGLEKAGQKIKEAAGITADTVKDAAKDVKKEVKGGAEGAGDATKKQAGKALDAVSDTAKDIKHRTK